MSQHSAKGAAWDKVRVACLDRDGWTCAYCGKPLVGDDATADHITPRSQGGTDDLWNLIASCRADNGRRQDKPLIRMNYVNPRWLEHL